MSSVRGALPAAGLLCALVWSTTTRAAAGDAGSSAAPLAVDWLSMIEVEGLPSCIDEDALKAAVGQLLRPERLNPARHVLGSVASDGTSWIVEFEVLEGDVLMGRRRLTFEIGACESFREDTELVLAMLLEGRGFDPPAPEPEPEPASAPPAPPPPPPGQPQPAQRVRGHFRLGAELGGGVFPVPSAGLRLEAGASFPFPLSLALRATWHMDGGVAIDGGGELSFGGYRLGGLACYVHRPSWTLSACAGVGFVSIRAAGVDVAGARGAALDTGSATLGGRFGIPLGWAWSVELGAEVEMWFARPEYVLLTETTPQVIASTNGAPLISWLALGYDF